MLYLVVWSKRGTGVSMIVARTHSDVIQPKEIELTHNYDKDLKSLGVRFNDDLTNCDLS